MKFTAVAEPTRRAALLAEIERLRGVLIDVRCKLHAANRPMLREGLRVELRDLIDAALRARAAMEE